MGELIPFDPKIHRPVYLEGAEYPSTEILISEFSPESKPNNTKGAWNIPTLWFDEENGEHRVLGTEDAWKEAFKYESRTGKKFPRFKDVHVASAAAKKSSDAGGATNKSLIGRYEEE